MNPLRIFHNPRCSKSRQTLELLQQRGLNPEIIEYLQTPPNAGELEQILTLLGIEPRQLMRRDEDEYQKLQLDNPQLSREQLIVAMVTHPRLIQRPIVINGSKAAIGRPPEAILDIL